MLYHMHIFHWTAFLLSSVCLCEIYLFSSLGNLNFLASELLVSQIQMFKMILKSEIWTGAT